MIAAAIILFLFMALKLFEFQKRLSQVERASPSTSPVSSTAVVSPNADNTKINELELKVQRLAQLVDKLQSELKEPKAAGSTLNLSNITSGSLMEYI